MDHDLSVSNRYAERYLLGELSTCERDTFEEHFFDCPECAEDVRVGFEFGESARGIFRECPPPKPAPARARRESVWVAWFRSAAMVPVAACFAMAVFIGYQNTVLIPGLRLSASNSAPEALASAVLVPAARGELRTVAVPANARFFQLSLVLDPSKRYERYDCELRSTSGKSFGRVPVAAVDAENTLNLLIPTRTLSAGTYEVALLRVASGATREVS